MKIYEILEFTAASGVELIFDDVIRKKLMSGKTFLFILKAYMMVCKFTKFRDPSFSQS